MEIVCRTGLRISQRTIRYYEELGLIHPRRSAGNHRIYSIRDRAKLKSLSGESIWDSHCRMPPN
ncbi:hypothetical protein CVD19_05230 [Bacillus sp. T33-2]|nr:hypothetical protein CVD19_05230 [Bacillus sp. T33-2]